MTVDQALADQLRAMIAKAERSLNAARRHLDGEDWDFASSKAYYAVFHMMQAALLTKRLTFSKHAGVASGFSQHFIKPSVFPASFGQAIQRLWRDREVGDYGYTLTVEPDEAHEDVRMASEIVSAVHVYLQPFLLGTR